MKHQATQFGLALFTTPDAAPSVAVSQALVAVPRYVVAKDDDNKTIKDRNGKPVLAKDEKGQLIVSSVTLKALPRRSDNGPDLHTLSGGLTGQAEMAFVERVEHEAAGLALAKLNKAYADGTHTFGSMRVTKGGRLVLGMKPKNAQVGAIAAAPSEALAKQLTERGYKVVAPVAESPATDGTLKLEAAPKTSKPTPKRVRKPKNTAVDVAATVS